jgi:hypothetical protein
MSAGPHRTGLANTARISSENQAGWVLTFSSACHLLGKSEYFIDYKNYSQPRTIQVLNANGPIEAVGEGKVKLYDSHGRSNILQQVLFVPNLSHRSYLSVRQLVKEGGKATLDEDGWKIVFGDVLLFSTDGGIIPFEYTVDINSWHERFGHVSHSSILALRSMVRGLDIASTKVFGDCIGCELGKLHREPFQTSPGRNNQTFYPADNRRRVKLALVHSAISGPTLVLSSGGNRYFITFIDDFSRFCKFFAIPDKRPITVLNAFKIYQQKVETITGLKIRVVRTGGGTEYQNEMTAYLASQGIKHEKDHLLTNGVAARRNRSLMDMIRPMLRAGNLPLQFWGEAARHANYLKNRLPTTALDGMTPFEAWHGHRPDVRDLRRFGSIVYVHQANIGFKKGIYVGFSNAGYRIQASDEDKNILLSKDVIVVE